LNSLIKRPFPLAGVNPADRLRSVAQIDKVSVKGIRGQRRREPSFDEACAAINRNIDAIERHQARFGQVDSRFRRNDDEG